MLVGFGFAQFQPFHCNGATSAASFMVPVDKDFVGLAMTVMLTAYCGLAP